MRGFVVGTPNAAMEGWGYHYLHTPQYRPIGLHSKNAQQQNRTNQSSQRPTSPTTSSSSPASSSAAATATTATTGQSSTSSPPPTSHSSASPKQHRSAAHNFIFGDGRPAQPQQTTHSQSQHRRPSSKSTDSSFNPASASSSKNAANSSMSNPYTYRGGRRYLRDETTPYPLPVDLQELHRQTLRTLAFIRIHGAPFCNPCFDDDPPLKVLEMTCGSALWSSACHDYFVSQGYSNVSFTGLDIAPLAPDLRQNGVNWNFVQWDIRKLPLPFPDAEFDFIFMKDIGLCQSAELMQKFKEGEVKRLLKPGGVVEVWESDYLIRILLSSPPMLPGIEDDDITQAEESATYLIAPGTAFTDPQNKYIVDYNGWCEKALDKLQLAALPCALVSWAFTSDMESFKDIGSRRVAIPLGETRWECEGGGHLAKQPKRHGRGNSVPLFSTSSRIEEEKLEPKVLTPDQASLRHTILMNTIQFIESMEPLLRTASEKRQDEWDRWWTAMMHDLLEQNGTYNGECLELGAWWAQKR